MVVETGLYNVEIVSKKLCRKAYFYLDATAHRYYQTMVQELRFRPRRMSTNGSLLNHSTLKECPPDSFQQCRLKSDTSLFDSSHDVISFQNTLNASWSWHPLVVVKHHVQFVTPLTSYLTCDLLSAGLSFHSQQPKHTGGSRAQAATALEAKRRRG